MNLRRVPTGRADSAPTEPLERVQGRIERVIKVIMAGTQLERQLVTKLLEGDIIVSSNSDAKEIAHFTDGPSTIEITNQIIDGLRRSYQFSIPNISPRKSASNGVFVEQTERVKAFVRKHQRPS